MYYNGEVTQLEQAVMTQLQMTDQLMSKLEIAAQQLHCSKTCLIEDALDQYLEQLKKQQIQLQTKQALAEVEAGDVVDGEEVMAWIDSWGSDNEQVTPKI